MRIACIHIPQFALQCASRLDPALRGAAVVVVGGHVPGPGGDRSGALHTPVVMACSRAAWAHGVRLGMTASSARARAPELTIVTADAAHERETVRAIADAALAIGEVVDLGGRVGAGGAHLAMYCAVPAKTRGQAFGDKLLALLEELGLSGRIGIADDRFTAWVAAAHGGSDDAVTTVPRGGSAAYLAPRPLSLLAIPSEVQHMLEALGVRTLGEFSALPAPSVHRPVEADYQALARGEGGSALRAYVPEAPVREEIVVGGNVLDRADALSGPAAIAMIAKRIALRLAGRGQCAGRLEVAAIGPTGVRELPVELTAPIGEPEELARALAPVVEAQPAAAANDEQPAWTVGRATSWRLRVVVAAEAVPGAEPVEVFAAASAPIAHLAATPATPSMIDPLAVVLSTSGSLFALSSPDLRAERRDAHRRTRRGKQRRGRTTPSAQSRLFDRRS
jgi:nucleotidyltransferase/DNA polymerase involved in DNA repair